MCGKTISRIGARELVTMLFDYRNTSKGFKRLESDFFIHCSIFPAFSTAFCVDLSSYVAITERKIMMYLLSLKSL